MLLVGSRAARFHYPEFRKPKDYDFIATRQQAESFLANHRYIDNSSHAKKIRAKVFIDKRPYQFEFDLVEPYHSNRVFYEDDLSFGTYDKRLGISYGVASPMTLFILKKSHIVFPIHWHKNIADYLFLKEKLFPNSTDTISDMTDRDLVAFSIRRQEVIGKAKYKQRDFNMDNSDFFKRSERFVKRKVEHDSIHRATCFYDEPLFLSCKEDLTKAEISEKLVAKLSFDDKIKLIQEEAMALSLERYIIPALIRKESFEAQEAYARTTAKMVYNYLPDFFKDFAADNFDKVLFLSKDYVTEFTERHPTFRNQYLK